MPVPFFALAAASAMASPSIPTPSARHDQLLEAFHELTAPLPPDGSRGPACLTPLVRQLTEHWDLFTAAEKAEITGKLAPFADDLRDMVAPPAAPPPPSSGSPCFTLTSGSYETLDDPDGYFQVQYESGAISASTAQKFLDALKTGVSVEVDEMGWRAPVGLGDYPIIAYVYDDSRTAGAYTTVAWCPSVGYMPYIVAGSGSFSGGNWYEDMSVHEFNHASQFAYTDTSGSINQNIDLWFWEATATWIQEYAQPDNNWWSTYISGYTDNPDLSMEGSSQSDYSVFYHMYGMAIWPFYLDEHVGGPEFVEGMWEYAASSDDRSISVDELITYMGEDFDEVYEGFIANNTVMDFDESRYFPAVDTVEEIDELPASSARTNRSEPEGLGQNYILFEKDLGSEGRMLRVSFDGLDRIDWYALVVRAGRSSVEEVTPIPLDDDQNGEVELEFSGDDDLYLVVSPRDNRSTSREYSWSAGWVDEEQSSEGEGEGEGEGEDTGDVSDGDDTDTLDTPDGEEGDGAFNEGQGEKSGGCACSSSGPTRTRTALGWAGAALALVLRRRVRSRNPSR